MHLWSFVNLIKPPFSASWSMTQFLLHMYFSAKVKLHYDLFSSIVLHLPNLFSSTFPLWSASDVKLRPLCKNKLSPFIIYTFIPPILQVIWGMGNPNYIVEVLLYSVSHFVWTPTHSVKVYPCRLLNSVNTNHWIQIYHRNTNKFFCVLPWIWDHMILSCSVTKGTFTSHWVLFNLTYSPLDS